MNILKIILKLKSKQDILWALIEVKKVDIVNCYLSKKDYSEDTEPKVKIR